MDVFGRDGNYPHPAYFTDLNGRGFVEESRLNVFGFYRRPPWELKFWGEDGIAALTFGVGYCDAQAEKQCKIAVKYGSVILYETFELLENGHFFELSFFMHKQKMEVVGKR